MTANSFEMIFLIIVVSLFGFFFYRLMLRGLPVTPVKVRSNIRLSAPFNTAINKILLVLRYELRCSDVYIARFHNGGNWMDGSPMDKFSITHGKAIASTKLLQDTYVNIFCSHWSEIYDHLIVVGEYCCADLEDCRDSNFKKEMLAHDFKACYLYLICQADAAKTPKGL
jgi:hypothetical protein